MKQSNDFRSLNQKISMSDNEQEKVQKQMNLRMNGTPDVRKSSTSRKYYFALATAAMIFMLILIPAIFNNNFEKPGNSAVVGDELSEDRLAEMLIHYDNYEILHLQEVESGVVVFFTYKIKKDVSIEMVSALFIEKTKFGWENPTEGGEHAIIDQTDISHEFIFPINEDSPFPLVYGKIISPEISEVLLRKVESKQEFKAEVFYSESGKKYWYAFVDIKPDELFELHGVTREGQVIYSIDTLYGNGGSGNGRSHELLEANPNAANFELTAEEREVYEKLKVEFDTQLLIGLSPITVAKLYVQAQLDEDKEFQYELYTDRDDMMPIDREEFLNDEMGHSSPEQIRETFFGIQDGTFHDRGDSGYISYTNLYGQEWGFQMVKEVDGSWAVSFMPIQ